MADIYNPNDNPYGLSSVQLPGMVEVTAPTPGKAAYTPDYASLLASDPGYIMAQGASANQAAAAAAGRQQSIRDLVTRSGFDFTGTQDPYGDLDPATLAAAKDNPFSTAKQIVQKSDEAKQAMEAALTSRRVLSSGQTGWELARNAQQRAQAEYDARNNALSGINQARSTFAQAESQRQMQLAEMMMAAMGRSSTTRPTTRWPSSTCKDSWPTSTPGALDSMLGL
jgi:hypothetical protein